MTLRLMLPKQSSADFHPRIIVIGVGGGGSNAVDNMITLGLSGVEFIAANTDAQQLEHSQAELRLCLGPRATKGLGAGANPEVGRTAAEESADELVSCLGGAHIVFIAAGMGGGTGTGAAPVIARIARATGALTVGVVTKPFNFEGERRTRAAEAGIKDLQHNVDTLIVVANQNLFRLANERIGWREAFKMADNILYMAVRCVTDLMVQPGLVNLDFADIRTVMAGMGRAMAGTGEAEGSDRASRAALAAIHNPLLEDTSIVGARGLLINITGGDDLTLFEVDQAANRIRHEVAGDPNVIFGSATDSSLTGKIRVSVIATGLPAVSPNREYSVNDNLDVAVAELPELPGMIPEQASGTHFTVSSEYKIEFITADEIDQAGNNIVTIKQILPIIRRATDRLLSQLNRNSFPELFEDVEEYKNAISLDTSNVSWGLVFGLGVMLENTAASARRETDRLRPSLEDVAQAALDSLLILHGPLILASGEGRELQAQADQLRMTKQDQIRFRTEVQNLVKQLSETPDVAEPEVAKLLGKASDIIGAGSFPERGTTFSLASVRNLATVLVSAAALASLVPTSIALAGPAGGVAAAGLSWVALESLKKSPAYASVTAALGAQYGTLLNLEGGMIASKLEKLIPFRNFVAKNESSLRSIAQNNPGMQWIEGFIDFAIRRSG